MKGFTVLIFSLLATSVIAADNAGVVTGSRLNVRTKPMESGEVVCQLLKGESVTIQNLKGNWAAIDIPDKCQAWIKSELINGKTVKGEASAHLGPTTVFTKIGTLRPGDTVTLVRKKGSWSLVRAKFRGALWVHADYITLPKGMERPVSADNGGKTSPITVPGGSGEVVKVNPNNPVGDVPSKPIKKPENLVIHEIDTEVATAEVVPISTAKQVTKSGVLIKLKKKEGRPFEYALAAQINNRFYPLFYLRKGTVDFSKWEFHRVTVKGDRQWVRGYPRPVVDVRSINPETE